MYFKKEINNYVFLIRKKGNGVEKIKKINK